jgi:hypothetical protein
MKLLGAIAAASCAAIALLAGAAPASAAQASASASASRDKTIEVSVKNVQLTPAYPGAKPADSPAISLCSPGLNRYNRTQACWEHIFTFTFYKDDEPVGTAVADLIQYMALNINGKDWTEYDTVALARYEGETAPIEVDLIPSCGSPCHAAGAFSGTLRTGLIGGVKYSDSIGAGSAHTTSTNYLLDYDAPGWIPLTVIDWRSPVEYRCDNQLTGIAGPGCVFPGYIPTLELSTADYGAAAQFVAWAQVNMNAHWGWYGHGKPLTRVAGTKAASANRQVICGRKWTSFAPWTADNGKVRQSDSCDEFPFAASGQSGAGSVADGSECVQLQAVKTNDKGGTPAKIWTRVKPIGSVDRGAACVRGHIPLSLNTAVGRDAYKSFIRATRLLNGDPFWLGVSA